MRSCMVLDRRGIRVETFAPMMIQTFDLDPTVAKLSSLDLSSYDAVISDFKARQSKQQAEKEASIAALRAVIDKTEETVRRISATVSSSIAKERSLVARKLAVAQQFITDGMSIDLGALLAYLGEHEQEARKYRREFTKALKELRGRLKGIDKLSGDKLLRLVNSVDHVTKSIADHYHSLRAEATETASQRVPRSGRVPRAYALYKKAFANIPGVVTIGDVTSQIYDYIPLYEVPVSIAPDRLRNRKQLLEIECQAHSIVEKFEPALVGAFAFRYEPAISAA
jgi:hypothetical protein